MNVLKPFVPVVVDNVKKLATLFHGALLWLPWRYVQKEGKEKPGKLAFTLKNEWASTNQYGQWEKFETALAAFQKGNYSGLGVLMCSPFVALDRDNCKDLFTGEWTPEAKAMIARFPSAYIEESPGGFGLRFFLYAPKFKRDKARWLDNNRGIGMEYYAAGCDHFVSVTGKVVQWGNLQMDCTKELTAALDELMARPKDTNTAETVNTSAANGVNPVDDIPDDELLNIARFAKNGFKFSFLYDDGNWQSLEKYDSQSEADQALYDMLYWWTGGNADRTDDLFAGSALAHSGRCAWDMPHYREHTREFAKKHVKPPFFCPRSNLWPETYTDTGNGDLFAQVFADRLRHTPVLGWLEWTGTHWEGVEDSHVVGLAVGMLKDMRQQAMNAMQEADAETEKAAQEGKDPPADSKKSAAESLEKWARKCLDHHRPETCVTRALPALSCEAGDFDSDPYTLATPDGIVDLKTGNIRPAFPSDLITKTTNCAPGTQGADKWNAFLDVFTGSSPEMITYLQLVLGSALIGDVLEERLHILRGNGANGKSTLEVAILDTIGDYGGTIRPNVFLVNTDSRFETAKLRGKRIVFCSELAPNVTLSSEMLKQLCSTGPLEIERKNKDPESVIPTHHLFMLTNYMPRVRQSDGGTWRRLWPIPIETTVEPAQAVRGYGAILAKECGPAILKWLIDGAKEFIRLGRKIPESYIPGSVKQEMEEYRAMEDPMTGFLRVCTEPAETKDKVKHEDLYNKYVSWCYANNENPTPNRFFRKEFTVFWPRWKKEGGIVYYTGLRLKE